MDTVLICDDEKDIVSALKIYLNSDGYKTIGVYNGSEAVERISEGGIDICLLDIMMPGMDGIETIARIREISNIPVIFLTAKSQDLDKVLGLNLGADDYITKPFNPVELLARVRSQLRRYKKLGGLTDGNSGEGNILVHGGIELNDNSKSVTVDGDPVNLTKTEFDILRLFLSNIGKTFTPGEIYTKVWKGSPFGTENTIAVHIRHLREKIEIDPGNPKYIKVVWGHGYKMEDKI